MTRTRPGTHARVESARQSLVHAEEGYLRAHEWQPVLLGDVWLWVKKHPAAQHGILMHRGDAVGYQHNQLGDKKDDTGR